MAKENYKSLLCSFVQEIKELENPSFVNPENWTLCHDLLNGVSTGISITNELDRKLLHKIGLKYGLIPLCKNEVVGLEMLNNDKINFGVVETIFGRLKIPPKKG